MNVDGPKNMGVLKIKGYLFLGGPYTFSANGIWGVYTGVPIFLETAISVSGHRKDMHASNYIPASRTCASNIKCEGHRGLYYRQPHASHVTCKILSITI